MFYDDNTIGTHFCYEMFAEDLIVEINDLKRSETGTYKVLEKNNSKNKTLDICLLPHMLSWAKLHNLCP